MTKDLELEEFVKEQLKSGITVNTLAKLIAEYKFQETPETEEVIAYFREKYEAEDFKKTYHHMVAKINNINTKYKNLAKQGATPLPKKAKSRNHLTTSSTMFNSALDRKNHDLHKQEILFSIFTEIQNDAITTIRKIQNKILRFVEEEESTSKIFHLAKALHIYTKTFKEISPEVNLSKEIDAVNRIIETNEKLSENKKDLEDLAEDELQMLAELKKTL